ncbi:MAG: hypothetical protein QM802_26755 [Agriterribacter sp.]
MNCTNLSDYQLYELIQNEKLDKAIRQTANEEFNRRKLSLAQLEDLIAKHDSQFVPEKEKSLKTHYKLLLIVCPFFIEIHSLFAGRMLAKGQKQKWKDYWIYICLGFSIWTIGIVLYAKYHPFTVD